MVLEMYNNKNKKAIITILLNINILYEYKWTCIIVSMTVSASFYMLRFCYREKWTQ